jgi:thiol-disulfide isomerase/thioredoxin
MKPIVILLLLLGWKTSFAQNQFKKNANLQFQRSAELLPGEQVPGLHLVLVNGSSIQLSELKGKLVILDFWGVHCAGCIQAFPQLQAIQEKFRDKLQVVLVTKDNEQEIRKLFARLPALNKVTLPIVPSDSILSSLFYYQSVPTQVWIDEGGVVIQKTSSNSCNEQVISDYLSGKKINLIRKEERADFEWGAPLFLEGAGRQFPKIQYYALLMGRPEGLYGLSDHLLEKDSLTGKVIRILRSNSTILELFQIAYMEGKRDKNFLTDRARVCLDVERPENWDFPKNKAVMDLWKQDNLYSYEIKIPASSPFSIYELMQQDLLRYFGYVGTFKKANINCLVVKAAKGGIISSGKAGPPVWVADENHVKAENVPSRFFLDNFKKAIEDSLLPFVNEAVWPVTIDLDLNCSLKDVKGMRSELRKHGIELSIETRDLEMFYITKKE